MEGHICRIISVNFLLVVKATFLSCYVSFDAIDTGTTFDPLLLILALPGIPTMLLK